MVTELFRRRLHSRALKMGSELQSRCSCSLQDSTSTHRCSEAQQRLYSIRTHWLLCSPPPRLFLLFFCRSRAFLQIRGSLITGVGVCVWGGLSLVGVLPEVFPVSRRVFLMSTSTSGLSSHPVSDDKRQTHDHEDEAQSSKACGLGVGASKVTQVNQHVVWRGKLRLSWRN